MTPFIYLVVSKPDYPEFLAVCVDRKMLPVDYETFLQRLEKVSSEVSAKGVITAQINIKPKDFAAWCKAEGISADTHARMRYAAHIYHLNSKK